MLNKYIYRTIVGIVVIGLISCSQKTSIENGIGREDALTPSVTLPEETLYQKAENAYKNSQYSIAEEEYKKALSLPSLSTKQRSLSYVRLASIVANRADYTAGLSYLLQAITLQPALVENEEWVFLFQQAVLFLSNEKALDAVHMVLETCHSTEYFTGSIYVSGAYLLWIQGRISDALFFAKEGWETARNEGEKAKIESFLYTYVKATANSTVNILFDTITEENKSVFPYNIFYLEKAVTLMKNEDRSVRVQGASMLDFLRRNEFFANQKIIPSNTALRKELASMTKGAKDIVFLLPLSSASYKKFTQQIINGAEIAKDMVHRVDSKVRVHYINTESKNWVQQLKSFPAGTIIGGPLRQSVFTTIEKYGLSNKYVFLTFLQTLPQGVEGNTAWRFYNSPQDQIDALYKFSNSLGITSYGILYPQDNYANKMVTLFKQNAGKYKSSINKAYIYKGKESLWTKEVASYLNTRFINNQPLPVVSFGATFLPDSFKNATILIPNFFYNGEQKQVILGTSLWEERGAHTYTKDTFQFAVFPSPFNPSAADEYTNALTRGLQDKSQGNATRWSSLGFDFVRYAYAMSKVVLETPYAINTYLATNKNMKWTGAPLSWSRKGICRQSLFIVTPDKENAKLVNIKQFAKELGIMYKRQENRINAVLEESEVEK